MRSITILVSVAAFASLPAVSAVAAEPAPVVEPRPIHAVSASEPVRISPDSFVIRMSANALQSSAGRARLLASLQETAGRLCADVRPRANAPACERDVIAVARLRSAPAVGQAIGLAQAEQQGTALASIR
jgi:hypothetical protein